MLNELESLSQNIGRLIKISERHRQRQATLEQQLDQLRAEFSTMQGELVQVRDERDTLAAERDSLSSKIDDAQIRLNAILEKLPRTKPVPEPDHQLALLPQENGAEHAGALHEEAQGQGEKA